MVPGPGSGASHLCSRRGDSGRDHVGDEVLSVAPEDTLGEVAERMQSRGVGSAVVSDFGR